MNNAGGIGSGAGHLGDRNAVLTTANAQELLSPTASQTSSAEQIYWVPCYKTDTSDGAEYHKIPDMQGTIIFTILLHPIFSILFCVFFQTSILTYKKGVPSVYY